MRTISTHSSPEHETRRYATLNRIQRRRPVVSSGSNVSGCLLTILHHLQSSCRTAPDMPLSFDDFAAAKFVYVDWKYDSAVPFILIIYRDSPGVPITLTWPLESPNFSKRLNLKI